jgi:NAD/NADP transhydrogenase beta subunit
MNPWINLAYLVAAVLFILGLKGLTHPRTAVRGNLMGASGMLLAIIVTLFAQGILNFWLILLGLLIGGGIGALMATRVQMTQMPQMVALLNGFGGIASALVAGAALSEAVFRLNVAQGSLAGPGTQVFQFTVATFASGLIGAVTFWGSLVAYGKLEGITGEQIQQRLGFLTRGRQSGSMPDQEEKTEEKTEEQAGSESESEPQAQTAPEPEPEPQAQAQTAPEPEPEPQAQTAPEPEPEPQAQTGSQATSTNGAPEKPEPPKKPQTAIEPAQEQKLMGRWQQINRTLTTKPAAKGVLLGICVLLGLFLVFVPTAVPVYWLLLIVASFLGWYLVMPIGGADMPVVIALLNSYSGLAAAATGFVIENSILIITGSLVGASGLILTAIMCRAMNRSLTNVLFGVWVPESDTGGDDIYEGKTKSTSPEEIAMMLDGARRVVIVPGYGMAVAQAQHAVRDLTNLLESRGTEVEFAIHPVAGRMPGHMNVLLAEADISYDKLKEMDEVNPTFEQTDVAIVIGANDVTNPVARTDPNSPIAGMPILDVASARSVIVVKRSLSPGFAGIPNPLFAADNTLMFFTDAKRGMLDLVNAVKEV